MLYTYQVYHMDTPSLTACWIVVSIHIIYSAVSGTKQHIFIIINNNNARKNIKTPMDDIIVLQASPYFTIHTYYQISLK